MTRNVLTVACVTKLERNNCEYFEMIFFKPNNMPLSFASKNFILKCLSTFEQAQTNITKESSLKKGYLSWLWNILHYNLRKDITLKLYCGLRYTKLCMINRIWVLKQLWLQDNDHAWFHLQRFRWPVRNGEGAKNPKWKYLSPGDFELTSRQSTTGKSAP